MDQTTLEDIRRLKTACRASADLVGQIRDGFQRGKVIVVSEKEMQTLQLVSETASDAANRCDQLAAALKVPA